MPEAVIKQRIFRSLSANLIDYSTVIFRHVVDILYGIPIRAYVDLSIIQCFALFTSILVQELS